MPIHTFPLDGPINLQVRIGQGSVTVDTEDDLAVATVRLEPRRNSSDLLEQTTVEMRGRTLVVSQPRQGGIFELSLFGGRRAQHGLDVHVVVPSGTAVKISTMTAPIVVAGRVGGADIAFGAADASLREVDGDLRLRYGSGSAKAVKVSGSVEVRSGSGNAQFGEIGGALNSGSGSGDLRVRVAHGAVRSRCGAGDAHLGEVHGDVDLTSGSGGMEIGLPEGMTARVDMHTGSGQLRSDLPIEDQPTSSKPAITLRARTGSGDVRLFRAA
jgi:hypothetical protein